MRISSWRLPVTRILLVLGFLVLFPGGMRSQAAGSISLLTPAARMAMTGKAWSPGCPVPLDDLRAIQVTYLGFDGLTHTGTLVMHKRFAAEAATIFAELYAIHFPIRKVDPYENYKPGGENAEKDVTVGFYCRKAQDAPTEWSGHAYGVAVDLNPLENPFLDAKEGWWPSGAAAQAKRDDGPGKISPTAEVFRVFARHGWAWGGFYAGEPDYMHFYKAVVGGSGGPLDRPYVVTGLAFVPEAEGKPGP